MKYDVFISYSRKDYVDDNKTIIPGNIVSQIKEMFDNNKISYWFDEDGVYSGDTFAPAIARNIKDAKIFLFISSENSNASEWTSNEIATAYSYKKKIIPFRYDNSPYNDSVIMYIARLDYIEHKANTGKSLSRLLSSVQAYLKEEVEKEQKDYHNQEQERIVSDIQFHIKTLNNEMERVRLDREKLLQKIEQVTNITHRNTLKSLILQNDKTKEIKVYKKASKLVHIIYCTILAAIIVGVTIWIVILTNDVSWLHHDLYTVESRYEKLQETLYATSNHIQIPFIIEDIELKNEGDKWGDPIIGNESTYISKNKIHWIKKGLL